MGAAEGMRMGLLFKDDLLDEFGSWPIAYIPYGGADFGEIAAVAKAVGGGDGSSFHSAWVAAGDRLAAEADAAERRGSVVSARELFLRSSVLYSTSLRPLFGAPVDPRLLAAYKKQVDALDRGFRLFDPPVLPRTIPFESVAMPAYFVPAAGFVDVQRPTIIFTNGYDGTITDMLFASAAAARARGYNSLLFDGPGQGSMLFEHDVPLRPEWERVITAVVDFALTIPQVDPKRIVLSGWSLGGYLAPRAASGEHRLAACVADPGQWAVANSFRQVAIRMGASESAAADLGSIDDSLLQKFNAMIAANKSLHWKVVQRGFWANGQSNLRDYLREIERFTLDGRIEAIRCPTLLTVAENDPLAGDAQRMYEALKCQKKIVHFAAAEGAGDHCEMMNRSLLNRTALDWLDETLD
jgi:pimeloyl-ACP methyl ester carboxylesterase